MLNAFPSILAFISIFSLSYGEMYVSTSFGTDFIEIQDPSKYLFFTEDDGFCNTCSFGYKFFEKPLRLELQITKSKHYFDTGALQGLSFFKKDFPIYTYTFVNAAYFDAPFYDIFPFMGLGLGYRFSRADGSIPKDFDVQNFEIKIKSTIYQISSGTNFFISKKIQGFFECRYRFSIHSKRSDKKYSEYDFSLGLRYFLC